MDRLGHRVHSWCVSRHMWTHGHDVPIVANQALCNWEAIDEAYCDRFVHRYRAHLSSFDAFIVDHPICFAALFEHTGRPVIANATTRYDLGLTGDPVRWGWLDGVLRRMYERGQLIPISNNRGDRAYGGELLGFDFPNAPSLCEYPRIAYSGNVAEWLRTSLDRPPLPRPYDWQALGAYRGLVHVPYNCSQMSVTEQYAAALPLVVPSPRRLLEMALADQHHAMSQVSCRRVCGMPEGEGLHAYRSPDTLARWVALSDWFDEEWMPFVVHCDGPIDAAFLESLDARSISRSMAAFNVQRRERILRFWQRHMEIAEKAA